jgi:hypothetical protein
MKIGIRERVLSFLVRIFVDSGQPGFEHDPGADSR